MQSRWRPLTSLGVLWLAGCSTVTGGPPRVADMLQRHAIAGEMAAITADAGLGQLAEAISKDCYSIPPATEVAISKPGGKSRRNHLVKLYLVQADRGYNRYETALLNDNRQLNFLATIASLGLATAGSVASAHTATVLSAANAGVIGERIAFTKEFLFDKTIAALQSQMRANRSAVATRIYYGLSRPEDEYTTCDAVRDLLAYDQAGTLAEGLTGIADTTAAKAGVEKAAEQAAKALTYATNPLAKALQAYFGPADDKVMAARVASGLKSLPTVGLTPPTGMSANEYFGRILAGEEYAAQQRALALAILMIETDAAARTPIVDALK